MKVTINSASLYSGSPEIVPGKFYKATRDLMPFSGVTSKVGRVFYAAVGGIVWLDGERTHFVDTKIVDLRSVYQFEEFYGTIEVTP